MTAEQSTGLGRRRSCQARQEDGAAAERGQNERRIRRADQEKSERNRTRGADQAPNEAREGMTVQRMTPDHPHSFLTSILRGEISESHGGTNERDQPDE